MGLQDLGGLRALLLLACCSICCLPTVFKLLTFADNSTSTISESHSQLKPNALYAHLRPMRRRKRLSGYASGRSNTHGFWLCTV